jgi:type III pantothenate kinase
VLLALDIGNTNIEIGILSDSPGDTGVIAAVRFFTRINITSDELGLFILNFLYTKNIDAKAVKSMIFSSVVPPLNGKIRMMYEEYFSGEIYEVDDSIETGIRNCYKNPREVGSDRLVNAAAVFKIYGKDSIIVDMGTATTLCVLKENGDYLGGTIMPGIITAAQALTEKASRLPAVNIRKKEQLLTDDTASAIESGVYYSNYFALKGMIGKLAEEVGFKEYLSIGTGGYVRIFKDDGIFGAIDYSLSLKGLKIIHDLNRKN